MKKSDESERKREEGTIERVSNQRRDAGGAPFFIFFFVSFYGVFSISGELLRYTARLRCFYRVLFFSLKCGARSYLVLPTSFSSFYYCYNSPAPLPADWVLLFDFYCPSMEMKWFLVQRKCPQIASGLKVLVFDLFFKVRLA